MQHVHAYVQDQEAEVRVAAAEASVEFCGHVPMTPAAFLADMLVPLKNLATDSHQHVRCALASKALQLTPQCTLDDSSTHMLDLILTLLKDKARSLSLPLLPCPLYPSEVTAPSTAVSLLNSGDSHLRWSV